MGLALVWPAAPVQAQIDRSQLLDIASGLDILRDRLTYKRSLLNTNEKGRDFSCGAPENFFSDSGEFMVALEFYLVATTSEGHAKIDRLLQTLKQLDSAAEIYVKAVRKSCRITQAPKDFKLTEADQERLREVFLSRFVEDPYYSYDAQRKRLRALFGDYLQDMDTQEDGRTGPLEKKVQTLSRQPETVSPKKAPTEEVMGYASGSLAPGLESDVFPPYAVAPLEKKAQTQSRQPDELDRETTKLAWTDLDLQYKVALDQIDELRNYLLKGTSKNLSNRSEEVIK